MGMYKGPDRRKHERIGINFVVSYKLKQMPEGYDLSQTRNISQGGMMITTNNEFDKGAVLEMSVRVPFIPQRIKVKAEVVESKVKVRGLIYETRVRFLGLDEDFFVKLGVFIQDCINERN